MIVRSIRLKNIKSYGEGTDGNGITIAFDAGINRIAGRNGHGKSTLIESLGYALFLTRPLFEENFDISTYLLRSGEKTGEIDVTFEHDGEVYRVERGVGAKSPRRSKVVQLSDGSIAAEDDAEVSAFLCRLLGCLEPGRLSELFAKLIGVKQGRLAWPFDSKPAEARKHFEPLLDVEIFRECFDRLRPVVDTFEALSQQEATRLAAVAERMRDRQDAPARVKDSQLVVEEQEKLANSVRKAQSDAEKEKSRLETLEQSWRDARDEAEKAKHAATLATTAREHAAQRLKEATDAAAIVEAAIGDFRAFVEAEQALVALQQQQREKALLARQRGEAHACRVEWDGKAAAAKTRAEDCLARRDSLAKRLTEITAAAGKLRTGLEQGKAHFDCEADVITHLRTDGERLRHWLRDLSLKLPRFGERVADIERTEQVLRAWEPNSAASAHTVEKEAAQQLEVLSGQLTGAQEVHASLQLQLAEISGGVCPFLKESCRQFDPKKVSGDIREREAAIATLQEKVTEARAFHRRAKAEAAQLASMESEVTRKRVSRDQQFAELRRECAELHPSAIASVMGRMSAVLSFSPFQSAVPSIPELPADQPLKSTAMTEWLAAAREFEATAIAWFQPLESTLRERFQSFEQSRVDRLRHEHDLGALEKEQQNLDDEIRSLTQQILEQQRAADDARANAEREAVMMAGLDGRLKAFEALDDHVAQQQGRKARHSSGHERYVATKPLADALPDRQRIADRCHGEERDALLRADEATRRVAAASSSFDPAALEAARKLFHEKMTEAAVADTRLVRVREELERERQRLREHDAAVAEHTAIELEMARIQAGAELTEKARGVLKNAAPYVAQHLCKRIAGRAQQIFNCINHEPSELEWSSERYSLRIQPGDRRFAMLSGGEQTKLALSMTLAMIQEFSGLKFCVFDEPTYGVDGDSRSKLADAIVELQQAASFDQLLLVSHDDAFDGRIEHTVRLSKSVEGTQPVAE